MAVPHAACVGAQGKVRLDAYLSAQLSAAGQGQVSRAKVAASIVQVGGGPPRAVIAAALGSQCRGRVGGMGGGV
jgi:hypothetical protein